MNSGEKTKMKESNSEKVQTPTSLLETTLNTRDLGGYPTENGNHTRYHSILRSDIMKYANERDIIFLRQKQILTIIDVRSEKDAIKAPNSLRGLEGFQYWNFPIEEGSGVPESPEAVPESYLRIAEAQNIGKVFRAIAEAPQGVLFHCTAGKDRSGVIAAILLMLAGVAETDIIRDYMLTKECNAPRFELLRKNFPDLNMEIVIPKECYMRGFLELFCEKYGTAGNYFRSLGWTEAETEQLAGKLR